MDEIAAMQQCRLVRMRGLPAWLQGMTGVGLRQVNYFLFPERVAT